MRQKTSEDTICGIKIRDIIEKEYKEGSGTKVTHDEGFNKFTFFQGKDGKYYIDNFIYDFVNDNWYHRTFCEVLDGKKVKYEILKEIYGE